MKHHPIENDLNDPILRALIRELEQLDQDVEKLKAEIASRRHKLRAASSQDEDSVPIVPGQYRGLKTSDALEKYLEQRGGGPVNMGQAAMDLATAGVRLANQPGREIQNMKIMLNRGKNPEIFSYDKATDAVSLARGPRP